MNELRRTANIMAGRPASNSRFKFDSGNDSRLAFDEKRPSEIESVEENLNIKVKVLEEFFRHHLMVEQRELSEGLNAQSSELSNLASEVKELKMSVDKAKAPLHTNILNEKAEVTNGELN